MARHLVHHRNGEIDEYQELPDTEHLEPHFGFEFAEAGILVLRFEGSDHLLSAFAPTAWTSVSGTALGDRGRRSSSGR